MHRVDRRPRKQFVQSRRRPAIDELCENVREPVLGTDAIELTGLNERSQDCPTLGAIVATGGQRQVHFDMTAVPTAATALLTSLPEHETATAMTTRASAARPSVQQTAVKPAVTKSKARPHHEEEVDVGF